MFEQAQNEYEAHAGQIFPGLRVPAPAPEWYAVSVRPRHEKKILSLMHNRRIRCFVPVYRSVRRWKDRRKELDLVLFPGYVFVQLDLLHRLDVLTTPGVLRFVAFQGRPMPVNESEVRAIASSLDAGLSVQPHPFLTRGRRVRVVRGPLAGIEGSLTRRKEKFRLVLSVDLIMKSMAVEIDESDVVPC
jgi:transcription antitermination factor NusG